MPTLPHLPTTPPAGPELRPAGRSTPTFEQVVEAVRDGHPRDVTRRRRWPDTAAYALIIGGIYGLLGPLFFMGAKEKIFFAVPAGIEKMFSGTFVSSVPGTGVAWFLVGVLEACVVATLAISLVRGEFRISQTKPWLLVSIALSMFAYAVVAFGDTIASQFDGTASLYTYFATSGVLLVLVLLMPPYRPASWLSSIVRR